MRLPFILTASALTAALAGAALVGPAGAHETGSSVQFGLMAYFDMNRDGVFTRDEYDRNAPEYNGAVFVYADLDNDGVLTKRELYRAARRVRQNEGRRWRR